MLGQQVWTWIVLGKLEQWASPLHIIVQKKYLPRLFWIKGFKKCVTLKTPCHLSFKCESSWNSTGNRKQIGCAIFFFSGSTCSLYLISIIWMANPGPTISMREASLNKTSWRQQCSTLYSTPSIRTDCRPHSFHPPHQSLMGCFNS